MSKGVLDRRQYAACRCCGGRLFRESSVSISPDQNRRQGGVWRERGHHQQML